jgi:adenine/guanine phosphoribosyltransferase-like PRPP-binding protein
VSDNEQPSDAFMGIDLGKGLNEPLVSWVGSFDPKDVYCYSGRQVGKSDLFKEFLDEAAKVLYPAATVSVPNIINTPAPEKLEPPKFTPPADHPVRTAPEHTKNVFDISTLPLLVRWAEDLIYQLKADAIVACGHSGLVLAGAVSYVTRVPVIAVRKEGEPVVAGGGFANRVSANLVRPAERWVWLDDFLASGRTFRNSLRELKRENVVAVEQPVAILSYHASQHAIDMWPSDTGFPPHAIREYGYRE